LIFVMKIKVNQMETKMKKQKLGNTSLKVSALGLGCMGMSFAYGPRDDAQSIATLHRALDLGINFWDTADMYGQGHNEELVGKVVRANRNKVFIATKFGFRYEAGFDPNDMKTYKTYFDGSPEYVKQACEASLKRLGVETEQPVPEGVPALCRARMIHEYPLIPDLERIEQMIAAVAH